MQRIHSFTIQHLNINKMPIWPTHNCGIDCVLCLLFTKYAKYIFSNTHNTQIHTRTHLIYIEYNMV